jgi:hypothetical protein
LHSVIAMTIDDFSTSKVNTKRKYINKKMMTNEINAIVPQQIHTIEDYFIKMEDIKKMHIHKKKETTTCQRY